MPKEIILTLDQLKRFWELCVRIDGRGNHGEYAGYRKDATYDWHITLPKFKPLRDGILHYSRGHGWRVRKKPQHWKVVFRLRFPAWREYEAQVGEHQAESKPSIEDEIPF